MGGDSKASGPDLKAGIPLSELGEGAMVLGQVDGEAVLLARIGGEILAIGATCTHYGGPLAEGLMVGDTVRCPWHHAYFSLRTGEALAAPAFTPVRCWRVERKDGWIFVRERMPEPMRSGARPAPSERIVIIGGGAAGFAATEMLHREGFGGALTLISADESVPYDRPNLSKDYLAGTAPEDWIPLRPRRFYAESGIDLRLGTEAAAIDLAKRKVKLTSGGAVAFTKLLLATGSEPVRLKCPGAELPHVLTLRSLADCRAIIAQAKPGSRAVIVGASFIGLEAAAALR